MRLLVVSDIHSNLDALRRVLDDAEEFDAVINAGDVVGYGPDPNECIEVADDLGFRSIAGNHDHAVVTGDTSDFNPYAAEAVAINRRLINEESRSWLEGLRMEMISRAEGVKVAVFHGSPYDPLNEYLFPEEARLRAAELLKRVDAELLILGHTHVPYVFQTQNGVLLNPGSVGQPRDGDPRASYMIVELGGGSVNVVRRRVEYNIQEVAMRMRRLGLPEILASRLFYGW